MTSRDDPEWLTLGQAARFLGVAQSTIRAWSDSGRVPAFYTPGRHRRYRRRDLEAFVERSGPGRGRRPVVLMVGDDEAVREHVRAALELECSVRVAGNADEATRAIEDRRPDLILLDLGMSHADGWEILRRAQRGDAAPAIPVVTFGGTAPQRHVRPRAADTARDLGRLVEQARTILSGSPRSSGTGPP